VPGCFSEGKPQAKKNARAKISLPEKFKQDQAKRGKRGTTGLQRTQNETSQKVA